ncbi:hypothetical protein V1523DRAFT_432949, partial [Lipomyces doorenjongii]
MVIFLRDLHEQPTMAAALDLFCQASGSRIHPTKSFTYYPAGPPLAGAFPGPMFPVLEADSFRYLGVPVGRRPDTTASWASIVQQTINRMHQIPMFDLPYVTRCRLINIYCFSKVVYLDQFVPASTTTLDSLTLAAATTISGGESRPLFPLSLLLRHLPAGGFGLFDLSLQLDGARAQW